MEQRTNGIAEHRPLVRAFLLRLLGNEAQAEDLTQETLLRAHDRRSSYRSESSVRSWLCAIAMNLARDHFRKAKRNPSATVDEAILEGLPSDEEDLETALLQAEMSSCIGEYMMQLPRPQYEVVTLHDAAGLTHTEIAELLEITVANSRVRLHRGRVALRSILQANCTLTFKGDPIPCERKESTESEDI